MYKKRSNEKRSNCIKSNKINVNIFKLSFCVFVVIFVCLATILNVTASNSVKNVDKQYKSILINEGDTLWNIAQQHNNQTLSCISNSEYIEDVMSINNISGDSITAGNYIIVPIYVAEQ